MEIHIREKSYKIAWEFVIAPFLLLLVIVLIVLSNLSTIRRVWIDYSENFITTPMPTPLQVTINPTIQPQDAIQHTRDNEKASDEAYQNPSPSPSKLGKVNINKAGMEELMSLPFIGEVKAKAIIAYRTEHGPFKTIEELDKIKGIGPKTLENLRPLVTTK